jgi:hypothetical protein
MSESFLRRYHPVCGATAQTKRSLCVVSQAYRSGSVVRADFNHDTPRKLRRERNRSLSHRCLRSLTGGNTR